MYGIFPKRMELSYLQQDDTSVWAYIYVIMSLLMSCRYCNGSVTSAV